MVKLYWTEPDFCSELAMRSVSCFCGLIDRVSCLDHCVVPSGDYVNCGPNGVERLSCFGCLASTVSPIVDT